MEKFDRYDDNLMYDVVAAVLKLQGKFKYHDWPTDANYIQVHKELSKSRRVSIDDIVKYLRFAEQCGYIRGHGGCWNHHGRRGGSKKWHFLKWPPYPYYELMEGNNGE